MKNEQTPATFSTEQYQQQSLVISIDGEKLEYPIDSLEDIPAAIESSADEQEKYGKADFRFCRYGVPLCGLTTGVIANSIGDSFSEVGHSFAGVIAKVGGAIVGASVAGLGIKKSSIIKNNYISKVARIRTLSSSFSDGIQPTETDVL